MGSRFEAIVPLSIRILKKEYMLLPRPPMMAAAELAAAASCGDLEACVEVLFRSEDPLAASEALRAASKAGERTICQMLLIAGAVSRCGLSTSTRSEQAR